jgi:hypothetical protein
MLSGITALWLNQNSNLTDVTLPIGAQITSGVDVFTCGLTGAFDLTRITLGDRLRAQNNTSMTDVLFTSTTETFQNSAAALGNWAFSLHECDLGYVNFLPLSGINMDTGSTNGASISLQNNNMTTTEVNHILVDFDTMTTASLSGWAGVTLDISGSNGAPDGSSGGYDGTGATQSLIANGWSITTT